MFSLYDLLPSVPAVRIVDVGALDNNPDYPPPYAGLVKASHAQLIGFEPDLKGCMELNNKHGAPHRFFPLFVGSGGPAKFHVTNWTDTGSLYPPNRPVIEMFNDLSEVMRLVDVREVRTVRLDDVAEVTDIDYVKIDVQGSELDVFRGATKVLETAVAVHTEVMFLELYEGQPLFADIDGFLRSRGFWFHTFVGMSSMTLKPLRVGALDHGLNQRVWADAVYIRNPLQLASLPVTKLHKMAALMHDIYRSYDVTYWCLAAADAQDGAQVSQDYLGRLTTL